VSLDRFVHALRPGPALSHQRPAGDSKDDERCGYRAPAERSEYRAPGVGRRMIDGYDRTHGHSEQSNSCETDHFVSAEMLHRVAPAIRSAVRRPRCKQRAKDAARQA